MLLNDGHGIQGVLLSELGLDLGKDVAQVRDILERKKKKALQC